MRIEGLISNSVAIFNIDAENFQRSAKFEKNLNNKEKEVKEIHRKIHHHRDSMEGDLVFQVIDWFTTDYEDDDEEEEDEETTNPDARKKYLIKIFGMTASGTTVSLNVTQFMPYFYVKLPRQITQQELKRIEDYLRRYNKAIHSIKVICKKDVWGFTNNTQFWFLRISFNNHAAMKKMDRFLDKRDGGRVNIPGFGTFRLPIYESNVEPFLRFIHKQNIMPCGWVRVPAGKFKLHSSIMRTRCSVNAVARWKNVTGINKDTTAPFRIASFDLECTSSHGDFPVPKKGYLKLAREIGELHRKLSEEKGMPPVKLRGIVGKAIVSAFSTEPVEGISRVFTKIPVVLGDIEERVNEYLHEFLEVLKGNILYERDADNASAFMEGYDDDVDDEATIDAFEEMMAPKIASTKPSDSVLQLNNMLTSKFPPLEGDPIIQIGCVFQTLGQYDFHRVILTLGTCAPIPGVTVIQCETEKMLLMKWAELFRKQDPDVITGYNIFGFDMCYLYERAKELRCEHEFMSLGRIEECPSVYVEKNLSSSALGDNLLKIIQMDGRVLIDLMKVVQRDHKLDTYKLDAVANHFMKGGIKSIEGNILRLDTVNGVQVNSYIKLGNGEKVLVEAMDPMTLQVTLATPPGALGKKEMTWGLAKDDISPKQIFECQTGTDADRALIAKYCIQDCMLCNYLMMKLQILANNFGMANVCTVPLSYIFMRGQGVKIFSLVAKQCNEDGFVIPVVRQNEEEDDGYEGAIVLDPVPGIYIDDPISVLDYASLYPSSMISENISHDSIVLDPKYDNLPGYEYLNITYDQFEGEGDKKHKVGERVCRYAQFPNGEKGVIPRILQKLLTARKTTRKKIEEKLLTTTDGRSFVGTVSSSGDVVEFVTSNKEKLSFPKDEVASIADAYDDFQKAVFDGLQLAYKVTANSVYGQVGAKTSAVHMKDLAASTTATGRNLILSAKAYLEKECGAKVIYGDSVMPYTPITLMRDGKIAVTTIEDMATQDHWLEYPQFKAEETGLKEKEQHFPENTQVWTHTGWAKVKRVIRHLTTKKIYRIVTHTGLVDVTEDHSLLTPDCELVKPESVEVGQPLLHSQPVFPETDSTFDEVFTGDGQLNTTSQLVAQSYVVILQKLGYTTSIDAHDNSFRITYTKSAQRKDPCVIKKKVLLHEHYEGYVYDLETEAGVFHAGVGNLIVKNTDSVFAIFPNEELRVDPHTGAMERVKLRGKEALQASINGAIAGSDGFKKLLKKPHDLEYEKTFFPFIILSKKRYVGNLYEHDVNKFKQKSMGIVLKRRDNANIVKHVYGGIIDIILNETNVQKSLAFLNENLSNLIQGKVDMDMLVITKTLKGSYKNPMQIAHKVLADRMKERDPGSAPQTNDRIPYVYIRADEKKGQKMLQGDKIEFPAFIIQNKLEPDYKFYITNQLMKPVVQLYALALNQLKGYRKPPNYFESMLAQLISEGSTPKKAHDKIVRLKEREVEEILFKPFLLKLENKKNHMKEISSYFPAAASTSK